jgi:hypothetical protein
MPHLPQPGLAHDADALGREAGSHMAAAALSDVRGTVFDAGDGRAGYVPSGVVYDDNAGFNVRQSASPSIDTSGNGPHARRMAKTRGRTRNELAQQSRRDAPSAAVSGPVCFEAYLPESGAWVTTDRDRSKVVFYCDPVAGAVLTARTTGLRDRTLVVTVKVEAEHAEG